MRPEYHRLRFIGNAGRFIAVDVGRFFAAGLFAAGFFATGFLAAGFSFFAAAGFRSFIEDGRFVVAAGDSGRCFAGGLPERFSSPAAGLPVPVTGLSEI